MDNVDWMDATERSLIIRFFGVDPVQLVTPASESLVIGESDFNTIVDFYRFEYKTHEKPFWDLMDPALELLPNKRMPLEMARVRVGYDWLDFVTPVDIQYKVVYNTLFVDIPRSHDKHIDALTLMCNMMFISDFREIRSEYAHTDTTRSWAAILNHAYSFKQSLLS